MARRTMHMPLELSKRQQQRGLGAVRMRSLALLLVLPQATRRRWHQLQALRLLPELCPLLPAVLLLLFAIILQLLGELRSPLGHYRTRRCQRCPVRYAG